MFRRRLTVEWDTSGSRGNSGILDRTTYLLARANMLLTLLEVTCKQNITNNNIIQCAKLRGVTIKAGDTV